LQTISTALIATSWTKIVPKTRKTREFWAKVFGWLIHSAAIAVAKNKSAITKLLVGSGCSPLKMRNARPPMKAARIMTFTNRACSRLWSNSLRVRRRRCFLEARPRRRSRLRLRKSSMILLACGRRWRAVLLVSGDDRTNKLVAYHVALVEINDRNPGNTFQRLQRFHDARAFVRRKVDLSYVAGDHAFGMRANAGKQHEHLLGRGVLRFVQNHEGVVQRPAAHISERRHLDRLPRDRALDFFRLEHVAQRVIERPQIRRDLLFQLAWQKPERFAGFNRGSR